MKKQTALLFILLLCSSCKQAAVPEDKVITDRLTYVYNLKSVVDDNIWGGFNDDNFDVPMIYYGESKCYAVNPTKKFIRKYDPELILKNSEVRIYKIALLDSIPFHMHVTVSLDDEDSFDYKSPFMRCSNTELTAEVIPDVPSTEVWATMVMHEYFHGFQFRHPGYLDYFEKSIASLTQEVLKSLYEENEWYKESVDRENQMLLSAISSQSPAEIKSLVNTFFELRDKRRTTTEQKLNTDIRSIEQLFETMEGTARYVEFGLYGIFSTRQPDAGMARSDSLYHSYSYFKDFSFEESQWLYMTGGGNYYYATGFNILRLLDLLNVDYKPALFRDDLSIEDILRRECTF